MEFAHSSYLWCLMLLPILLMASHYAQHRKTSLLKAFGSYDLLQRSNACLKRPPSFWAKLLPIAAIAILVIAAATPRRSIDPVIPPVKTAPVVLVVDISKSMLATDVYPNRLTRGIEEIVTLLPRLKGRPVGLIAFAGVSVLRSPLTHDHEAIRSFLEGLLPQDIPYQGSDIGQALQMALTLFPSTSDPNALRDIILLSDGEDHGGHIDKALEIATSDKIRISTLGTGNVQGSLIPVSQPHHNSLTDPNGTLIVTKLNAALLDSIAHSTGGQHATVASHLSASDTLWQSSNLTPRASQAAGAASSGRRSGIATIFLLGGIVLFIGALMTTQD